MFGLGAQELLIILLIAFLVFGGKKLPEIGAGLGKAINSFKRGLKETEDAANPEKPLEKPAQDPKKIASAGEKAA
ncbi:twin-arginine translocase TatA/TatE family subunit [Dissulfurimicrobium hydrothermale]|uniref:twin-arginine translocase TatA/TatE family subunit n=1 Tax=Dissulfurimicrobium hydrothermale TaxID=1750598 RepID=UPI001EDAF400|nr:twin-arginine translocase TatA/TatE family subunit [Dissulfurimicrobium hydrothermale]UKL12999.1 twin-arginine translocase TatA/TatE family subunit [Dissulfurimicrobium hydrothermale]